MFFESMPPSSALRAASPLKGEAVKRVSFAQITASPLRGEAERSSDEGGIELAETHPHLSNTLIFIYVD